MINILYSTDYELFLGANNASEEEVLIQPTRELLEVCERARIPMNIFADVACIWRYRELGENAFPDAVEHQLKDALSRGHDVQTHLHPHWLAATREGNRWVYPPSKFLLGDLGTNDAECAASARELLTRAAEYLNGLLKPVVSGYRCVAYRAGGFGLQPREKVIIKALRDAGYLIDSSVVPGLVMKNAFNQIDFAATPDLPNYRIDETGGLALPASEGLFEVPIAASRVSLTQFTAEAARGAWRRVRREREAWQERGASAQESGVSGGAARGSRLLGKMASKVGRVRRRWFPLELRHSPQSMAAITRAYVDRYRALGHEDITFSLIIHSKTLSPRLLGSLAKYHATLGKIYGSELRAITYRALADKL